MVNAHLSAKARAAYEISSTATLTTLLYQEGLANVFMQGVFPVATGKRKMIGPAYTLRFVPSREDVDKLFERDSRTDLQRITTETVPEGHVLVVDSRGDPSAASGGALLALRMETRGVEGIVTDGGFRDSPEIGARSMPAYHQRPAAPPVLITHHPEEAQCVIGCGGVCVRPGDLIVGDDEGVVVVPSHLIEVIAERAIKKTNIECFIEEEIQKGRSIYGLYPPDEDAMREYETWETQKTTSDREG